MLKRILIGLLIGVCCAAIGLAVQFLRAVHFRPWAQSWAYQHYAYQEYSTPRPGDGFEWFAGYTGSQTFYWEEILSSRDFKLKLLRERGERPETKLGNLPSISAQYYDDFAKEKKGSLYIMMSFGPDPYPAEHFRADVTHDFIAISKVFVEAAQVRGVAVAPVGSIALYSRDIGSWRTVLSYSWRYYFLLCCGTAIAVALLDRKKNFPPNQLPDPTFPSVTPPADAGGAPSVAADH